MNDAIELIECKWPTCPDRVRFLSDRSSTPRVFLNISHSDMATLIGSMLEASGKDLLFIEMHFASHATDSISRVMIKTTFGDSIYAMPYDNGESNELTTYLQTYGRLLENSKVPDKLLLSAHSDGWFTFDSCDQVHGRLPRWAFTD